MRFTPTLRLGDVLVVLEGPARMLWEERASGYETKQWTPKGIWPDAEQRAEVREHLDGERPLLVLLDEARCRVPMLREEWQAAPCRLLRDHLDAGCEDPADDEVVEVSLPFLDWLPEAHRERAARFLAESDAELSCTPMAFLPPLMTEKRHEGVPLSPRFARRLLPNALTGDRLAAAVEHLFADASQYCAAATGSAR
ncbi:hypothetical protein [Streptomyces sp. BA2]|uniref:hypothetical protein n=1 Tax=Streptomyces sp. BA2 TaxID=436595 RepID=UPI0019215244|nr:hypothetical protein [Streptomyces sp. BA2]